MNDTTAERAVAVAWPRHAELRRELASRGVPCLLIVAPAGAPPDDCGPLEDWAREPVDPSEVALRMRTLRDRADTQRTGPRGATSATDAIVQILLAHGRAAVSRAAVRAAYVSSGGAPSIRAFDAALARSRRRLERRAIRVDSVGDRLLLTDIQR